MRRILVGLAMATIAALASSWARADDQQIAQQIVKLLGEQKQQGRLRDFRIRLEVDDGAVWLKGTVASRDQQRLALETARRVEGVRRVVNALHVVPNTRAKEAAPAPRRPSLLPKLSGLMEREPAAAPQAASAVGSEQLAARVAARLQELKDAGRLQQFDLTLHVDQGVVSLVGTVASAEQRELVVRTARQTPGVRKVVNELIVASPVSPASAQAAAVQPAAARVAQAPKLAVTASAAPATPSIAKTLETTETLQRGRELDRSRLTAFQPRPAAAPVEEAEPEAAEAQTAKPEAAASEVAAAPAPALQPASPGLVSMSRQPAPAPVVDRPVAPSDQQIADQIKRTLSGYRDQGRLRGFQLEVEVLDGQVWVSGHVASPDQQQLVLDVARRAPGVRQVVNDVRIASHEPAPVALASTAEPPAVSPAAAPLPLPFAQAQAVSGQQPAPAASAPAPAYAPVGGIAPARYDQPNLPPYAWPSYAAYPNYAALTYPKQYSATAWPYIGPFYPYPQVPLGWRKVTLEWDDGWWMLNFKDR